MGFPVTFLSRFSGCAATRWFYDVAQSLLAGHPVNGPIRTNNSNSTSNSAREAAMVIDFQMFWSWTLQYVAISFE
jgi:hypothetical protein